jgi:N-acetylglucosamine kinase-like BadF-type ATPase
MRHPLFLGVDGGGTSTTAWVADGEGRPLGEGVGGPSNIKAIGAEAARASLDHSIQSAFANAGLDVQPVEVACLGLAGFDRPGDKAWLESWASVSPWNGRLLLVNDGDLVVAAGTPDGWGVGLIAGTGSIAVGRDREGRAARAGGWGYIFGDEGSAYSVALAGLRKVARLADGRDASGPSALTRRLCEALGIESSSELVSAVYREGVDRARLALLAPSVVAASEEDPSIFPEILRPAGMDLAVMVAAVARALDIGRGPLPLAMAGSFLLNCDDVAHVVLDQLSALGYEVEASSVADPVVGALVLARRGWTRP